MLLDEKLISVIIPIYRVEEYLVRCIESVRNQTYKNLEIILVDDGSDDECPAICDRYAKEDSRIKVIHKKNGGLVSARRAAMPETTGEYIGYVDSDDYIDAGMFEHMYEKLIENQADIVVTSHYEEYPEYTRKENLNINPGLYEGHALEEGVYSRILYDPMLDRWPFAANCWNKLFKREIIYKRQMDVDEMITDGEDHAFVFPAMLDAKRIYFSDEAFYHHIIRTSSVSLNIKPMIFKHYAHLHTFLYATLSQNEYWEMYLEKQFPYHMKCFIFKYIKSLFGDELFGLGSDCYVKPYIFPFEDVEKKSRIILYGAGDVGELYYRQIKTTNYCKIEKWVAKTAPDQYKDIIESPDSISDVQYDKIVIAVQKEETAESIISDLAKQNIGREEVVWRKPRLMKEQRGI